MRPAPFTLALAMSCLALSQDATSAGSPKVLTGLRELSIVIEEMDEDAKTCNVTRETIESSARFILSQSKLRITDSLEAGYIYYRATVVPINQAACAYSLEVSVRAFGTLKSTFANAYGGFTIWSTGGLNVSARNKVTKQLEDTVESMTKRFVADWSKENP